MNFLERLGIPLPILQAPMAGVSTPPMAAAVSDAGGLGAIAVGATDAAGASRMIQEVRALTGRAFNVNLFVHPHPEPHEQREAAWLNALTPVFARYDSTPPPFLKTIYRSFGEDDEMLAMLVASPPPVISFHFGLPDAVRIAALRRTGAILLATATNLDEAIAAEKAGIDAVVAQGFEAGGHRGMFDPSAADDCLGVMALTRLFAKRIDIPVIAAGGIMDGAGIAAALKLGAAAAQLGTAFIACPESSADAAYRAALESPAAHTVMTSAISGRPARCLANLFTSLGAELAPLAPPDYPLTYDAGKALHAAAKAKGESGFGSQWAGQGAPLARATPAGDLVRTLALEMKAAIAGEPA